MTIIFGSRALHLSDRRRKAIADYMRWIRSLRKWGDCMERRDNERDCLNTMLARGEFAPPVDTSTPPRTEHERYQDRCDARDAQSQRALAQYDVGLRRGPN